MEAPAPTPLELLEKLLHIEGRAALRDKQRLVVSLDSDLLSELLALARQNPTTVVELCERLQLTLQSSSSSLRRLLALLLLDELFSHSKRARKSVCEAFDSIYPCILQKLGRVPKKPRRVASLLDATALQIIAKWHARCGEQYIKLNRGFSYLQKKLGLRFPDIIEERKREQAKESKVENQQQRLVWVRYTQMSDMEDVLNELRQCLLEMQGCFDILFPENPEEDTSLRPVQTAVLQTVATLSSSVPSTSSSSTQVNNGGSSGSIDESEALDEFGSDISSDDDEFDEEEGNPFFATEWDDENEYGYAHDLEDEAAENGGDGGDGAHKLGKNATRVLAVDATQAMEVQVDMSQLAMENENNTVLFSLLREKCALILKKYRPLLRSWLLTLKTLRFSPEVCRGYTKTRLEEERKARRTKIVALRESIEHVWKRCMMLGVVVSIDNRKHGLAEDLAKFSDDIITRRKKRRRNND